MYKNPLNNGDVSDYNSLKNQRNYSSIIKKYKKKLPTEPTELQKYYQYLTYQQPILDEAIYVAQRMKNEDINKQKDDFNFIEDLKIKREQEMKQKSQLEKDMNNVIRNDLFDASSTVKEQDPTPTITTDIEIENIPPAAKIEIQNDLFDNPFDDILSMAETALFGEEKFELSRTEEKKKKQKSPEELQAIEEKKAATKAKREEKKAQEKAANEAKREAKKAETKAKREEKKKAEKIKKEVEDKAILKIEKAILGKVKRERAKKELSALKK